MAEDDPAQRPRDEADRIGREGQHRADQRVVFGKEQPVEDQSGGRAVKEEIVPFDGGPDQACADHAAERGASFLHFSHALSPCSAIASVEKQSSLCLDCLRR
jgi:hypothetical protein